MSSIFQDANLTGSSEYLTSPLTNGLDHCRRVYEENRHRIYALAFWMSDNELIAEQLMKQTFERAFAAGADDSESIDRVLIEELEQIAPLNRPSLKCAPVTDVSQTRRNVRKVDLERAVVQLPPTERLVFLMHDVEGYDHARIGRLLSLSEPESQSALHEARLRMRELLSTLHS